MPDPGDNILDLLDELRELPALEQERRLAALPAARRDQLAPYLSIARKSADPFHGAPSAGAELLETIEGDSLPAVRRPAQFTLVPGYETVGDKPLGEGAMGVVWKAIQISTRRPVALKVMSAAGFGSERARRRFEREVELTAKLDHPHIARVYDSGLSAGTCFYAMELVDGQCLDSYCKSKKLATPGMIELMIVICRAVQYAHQKGIIHRDLKPSNILVDKEGQPRVLDFGLAKAIDGGEQLSIDGETAGTPVYMSPEQAAGRIDAIDTRSDVYTLGVIVFYLLSGQFPHETSGTAVDVMRRVREEEPRRLRAIDPRANRELEVVLGKAMAREPERRYGSAGELADDLERYLQGEPLNARPPTIRYLLRKKLKKYRVPIAMGTSISAVLVGMAVWSYVRVEQEKAEAVRLKGVAEANAIRAVNGEAEALHQKGVAEANAVRAVNGEAEAQREKGIAQANAEAERRSRATVQIALGDAAFSKADLAGMAQALDACPQDLRGQSWHYLDAKRDSSLGAVKIPDLNDASAVLAVPGKPGFFAVAGQMGKIAIVDVDNDRVVRTIASGFVGAVRLAFSGNGRVLAATAAKQPTLALFDADSGHMLKKLDLPTSAPDELALNPDGTQLVVGPDGGPRGPKPGPTYVLDTRNGRTQWSFSRRVQNVTFSSDGTRLMLSSSDARRQFNLVRASDGSEISHFDASVECQALSPSGKEIALGTPYGEVFVLDASTGLPLRQGRLYSGAVYGLAWTSDGNLITSGDEGKYGEGKWVFQLREPTYLTPMATFFGLKSGVRTPWSFNPESGDLLTLGSPPRRWLIPVGREIVKLPQATEQGWSGCFLSNKVLLGRKEFGLTRYDLTKPGQAAELPSDLLVPNRYTFCAVNWPSGTLAVGNRLATSPFCRELNVLTTNKGALAEKLKLLLDAAPRDLDIDRAGQRLAAVGANGRLQVFDLTSGKTLLNVAGKFERAAFAGADPDLVAISRVTHQAEEMQDSLVRIDAGNGSPLRTATLRFRVNALAVSADRKWVAVAGADQAVHLFDADALAETASFRAHDGEITALAFHPTAPIIATAAMDHSLKLWDYNSASLLDEFLGLGGTPVVLAFNPSGSLIAVDGQEHTTRIFSTQAATAATSRPATTRD